MRGKKSDFVIDGGDLTPEGVYLERRTLLKALGFAGLGMGSILEALAGCGPVGDSGDVSESLLNLQALEATPDARFNLDRELTDRVAAASFNNFYEFTTKKETVWKQALAFEPKPWQIEISGLVDNPLVVDVAELIASRDLQQRQYRHRCVEAWAMAVPWIGIPLAELLTESQPKPEARYVAFSSFNRPEQAPTQNNPNSDYYNLWPYFEGLTLPEAMNEATFLGVGIYGHELPNQHGAPVRVIVPWKYGYKGPKSITRIELTDTRPATFWNTLYPDEYDFWSNVNPTKPHPRWSQAQETMLGTGEVHDTLLYNGYGDYVGQLYDGFTEDDPRYGFG